MQISYFTHWLAKQPQQEDVSLEDFGTHIIGSKHKVATPRIPANISEIEEDKRESAIASETKKGTPAFSPTEYAPGTTRAKENVISMSAMVLDYDSLSATDAEKVLTHLDGFKCWLYTSYSHGMRSGWSFRIVLPLDKPVAAEAWLAFWARFQATLPVASDPSCKDVSRIYGLPYTDDDRIDQAQIIANEGVLLPVDAVMALSLPEIEIDAKTKVKADKLDPKEVRRAIAPIARQTKDKGKAQVALNVLTMLKGEAWTDPFEIGERHNSTLPMTEMLEAQFPGAALKALTGLWHKACGAMHAINRAYDSDKRLEEIARAYEGARARRLKHEAERRALRETERKAATTKARGDGKDTPYDTDDKIRLAALAGCEVAELETRWIVFSGPGHYVLTLNGYKGPYAANEVLPVVRDALVPAGVDTWKYSKEGRSVVPLTQVLQQYASPIVGKVFVDMTTDITYVDEDGNLHEACCVLRDTPAEYDAKVDQYLELLGGNYADRLKDWLATSTDLTSPTCALYFHGAGNSGKSLFPKLLASMYRGASGPTQLSSVISNFNDALSKCPIVSADEELPTVNGRKMGSTALRDIISSNERPFKRRYTNEGSLRGCIRLILGANNLELLNFGEQLTEDDQRAVSERFLLLHTGANIGEWLKVNGLDKSGIQRLWFDERRFAKHVMWLKETRAVKPGPKLIVHGDTAAVMAYTATSGALEAEICQWLVDVVHGLAPGKGIPGQYRGKIALDKEGVWLSSAAIMEAAADGGPIKTKLKVNATSVGRALSSISKGRKQIETKGGPQRLRVMHHLVNAEYLTGWMRRTPHGDPDAFLEVLANPDKYISQLAIAN